jgi:hypothetical protein
LIVWTLFGFVFLLITLIKDAGSHAYETYIWDVRRTIPETLLRVDLHSFVRIENRIIHEQKELAKNRKKLFNKESLFADKIADPKLSKADRKALQK